MELKIGDKLRCVNNAGVEQFLSNGSIYTYAGEANNKDKADREIYLQEVKDGPKRCNRFVLTKGESNMIKEVMADAKEFVKNNRSVIYTIVLVALVDHFCFKGALRERLRALIDKMLTKAESKVL